MCSTCLLKRGMTSSCTDKKVASRCFSSQLVSALVVAKETGHGAPSVIAAAAYSLYTIPWWSGIIRWPCMYVCKAEVLA